ncbi:MAG TPA: hypothetical protein VN748_14825 [Pseudonocardiaceae bacterium]|nr:hypothetical protein [Pseudonocardiaceae bacterium]
MQIAILLHPRFTALDAIGPDEVLRQLRRTTSWNAHGAASGPSAPADHRVGVWER